MAWLSGSDEAARVGTVEEDETDQEIFTPSRPPDIVNESRVKQHMKQCPDLDSLQSLTLNLYILSWQDMKNG